MIHRIYAEQNRPDQRPQTVWFTLWSCRRGKANLRWKNLTGFPGGGNYSGGTKKTFWSDRKLIY